MQEIIIIYQLYTENYTRNYVLKKEKGVSVPVSEIIKKIKQSLPMELRYDDVIILNAIEF